MLIVRRLCSILSSDVRDIEIITILYYRGPSSKSRLAFKYAFSYPITTDTNGAEKRKKSKKGHALILDLAGRYPLVNMVIDSQWVPITL